MFSLIRAGLSYSNIMATVAVFLALGGTSLAVAKESDEPASEQSESASEETDARGDGEASAGVAAATRDGDGETTDKASLDVTVSARCQEDEVLTGGGVRTIVVDGSKPVVQSTHPSNDDARTWTATVANANGNGKVTAVPYALCASPGAD